MAYRMRHERTTKCIAGLLGRRLREEKQGSKVGAVTTTAPSPLRFIARVLTFRFSAGEISSVGLSHLAVGLLFTWIVGIGRYWDNPRVGLLQHLGLGSIAYVLVLSAFLWLLLWPLRPSGSSYRHVVTFVSAVSPPALLYASATPTAAPTSSTSACRSGYSRKCGRQGSGWCRESSASRCITRQDLRGVRRPSSGGWSA